MLRSDFTFESNHSGYMLRYKGQAIGGVGSLRTSDKPKHWRHKRADAAENREQAEREIEHLLAGRGQRRFLDAIIGIGDVGNALLPLDN